MTYNKTTEKHEGALRMTEQQVNALKAIGGKEWEKGTMHRMYFNNLAELSGLECEFYGTGNVASATLDGEHISNGSASKMLGRLGFGKFWIDLTTGAYCSKDLTERDVERITDGINARVGTATVSA